MHRIWPGILAVALLLGACGDDNDQPMVSEATPSEAASPASDPSPKSVAPASAANTLAKTSALDVQGAKDFGGIPRYPDSWIVQASTLPRESYSACGKTWNKYDVHYQSAEPDNAKIVDYLTEKLISLGWAGENERNESGSVATSYLTKDKLTCVPAGTAFLQAISLVARSAIDDTIVFTLTVPSDSDPFAR